VTSVLVVSSVHPPDDPRIRHKLVESLRSAADVTYVTSSPGPAEHDGFAVDLLVGPRWWRSLRASWRIVRGRYHIASVHDPELLPAAIVAGLLRRDVVFDVHEDIPAQVRDKPWLPGPLALVVSTVVRGLLRLAERTGRITLAEPGYATPFARRHPVFPNYLGNLDVELVPRAERDGVVYLGDITEIRGAVTLVEAVGLAAASTPLTMIGRCAESLAARLSELADENGVELTLTGYLPHDRAMAHVAQAAVAVSPLHDVPNYRHSLPTKLLEYLALGVPVIASDLPGSRALEDLDGVVWVDPGDAVDLAGAIDLVLGSSELATAALAGAAGVRRRYRWPAGEVRAFYLT
jgi:glycosyltransferase involved in cell wall biosynthesis